MSIIWLLLISNNDWLVQKTTFYLHETQLSNHKTLRKKFTKIFEYTKVTETIRRLPRTFPNVLDFDQQFFNTCD